MTNQSFKMTQLAAASEIVAAVAVIIGLVFVGLELRRNTSAVEAATFQGLTEVSNDYVMTIAGDPELSRILSVGAPSPDDLSSEELYRYSLMERAFWVRMQNVYSQYVRGTLDPADWTLYESVMCGGVDGPSIGRVRVWPRHKPVLTPSLIDLVEACWGL